MCGLFGYSGRKVANPLKIKLLWTFSSKRGTDGTGIYFNNKLLKFIYEYGKSSGSSFDTVLGSTLQLHNDTDNTILGHCRSKTIGLVSLNNTHPFEYITPNGDKWIFAHNGTIRNLEELKTAYKPTVSGNTDSEVLGWILAHGHFNVLTEYKGAAAFTLYNDTKQELYIFKGASQHDSNVTTDERPLYYYKGRNGMYYASEAEILVTGINTTKSIIEFESNTLYKIVDGSIINKTVYDRSNVNSYTAVNNYHHDVYGYSEHRETGFYKNNKPKHQKTVKKDEFIEPNPQSIAKGSVYYYKNRYYRQGHLLTGELKLTHDGFHPFGRDDNEEANVYYFVDGLLLRNEEAYTKYKALSPHDRDAQLRSVYRFSIDMLHPRTIIMSGNNCWCYQDGNYIQNSWITPMFAKYKYYFNREGKLTSVSEVSKPLTANIEIWKKHLA